MSVGFCDPVTSNKCKNTNPDPVDNFDCPDAEGLGMMVISWILLLMYDINSLAKKKRLMVIIHFKPINQHFIIIHIIEIISVVIK